MFWPDRSIHSDDSTLITRKLAIPLALVIISYHLAKWFYNRWRQMRVADKVTTFIDDYNELIQPGKEALFK
jgi:hypothetical protein